jgi:hypothetical protein
MRRTAYGFLIVIAASLAACAHHEARVDCDGPLRPINLPAPKTPAVLPATPVVEPHS